MATVKISQMQEVLANEIDGEEFIPVVKNGVNKKVKISKSGVIYGTYAQILLLKNNNNLKAGVNYFISDRNIFIKAISTNKFALEGTVQQYCPAQYTIGADGNGNGWEGVFYAGMLPTLGNLVIWGGKVWRRNVLVVGTPEAIDDFTLSAHFTLIDSNAFTNGEYVLKTFSCEYDFENDWIVEQRDDKGNVIGCSKTYWQVTLNKIYNPCTLTDWNSSIRDNKCIAIYNNISTQPLKNNCSTKMYITNNKCTRIENNTNNGYITNCANGNITNNQNNGNINNIPEDTSVFYCKYNGDVDGDFVNIIGDVDGSQPKEISTATYIAEPWDWNNIYSYDGGDTIITIPFDYETSYNCTHVSMKLFDLIFEPGNVFIEILNADSHTKSNGQYAPVVVYSVAVSNGPQFILGGKTKA